MTTYHSKPLIFVTLDPVHVGGGGYRLGRVDMTIVREPGTNLPKVPGTSLLGAARSYAASHYGKPGAAGQHLKLQEKIKKREAKAETCPILFTFGTSAEDHGTGESGDAIPARAGAVSVSDARLLFFPVNSMGGPLWVTTLELLGEAGIRFPENLEVATERVVTTFAQAGGRINIGWLLLEVQTPLVTISWPGRDANLLFREVKQRLIIVNAKYFSQIVNSNLEVRTSVSINPETGAAAKGALFTYEAIPRATWLLSTAVEDLYAGRDKFPKATQQYDEATGVDNCPKSEKLEKAWEKPLDVLSTGLQMIEYLGVGGMGTRGFGRMKLIA